jgi:hypothetical protein
MLQKKIRLMSHQAAGWTTCIKISLYTKRQNAYFKAIFAQKLLTFDELAGIF